MNLEELAEGLAEETREYVKEVTASIETRIAAAENYKALFDRVCEQLDGLQSTVKAIEERASVIGPQGESGQKGDQGDKGDKGDAGETGAQGEVGPKGDAGEKGEQGPKGDIGERGENGEKGGKGDPGEKGDRGEPGPPGPVGERGIDGAPGKNGDRGEPGPPGPVGERGIDGAPGKNGESIHPDTVALMVREAVDTAVTKAMAGVQMPKDGLPGRDAMQIDVLPAIDVEKSYARGTWAFHAGGMIRAARATDPITATLAAAGWEVAQNGIAEETETQIDDRTTERTTIYTNGERRTLVRVSKEVIYRCVFKRGEKYRAGDCVTWDGSSWIASEDTDEVPGTSKMWQMSVRKGRDGRDK